ncbi:DNA repair protein RecO [Urechidicola sp. KH5]
MASTTKAIVINTVKYGESSLIVKCYTQERGMSSYMLKGVRASKRKKNNIAYYQPLNQLIIEDNYKPSNTLNHIKETQFSYQYQNLYFNVYKQSISFFLAEVLANCLKEEEANKLLFEFLTTAFQWLDTHDDISNFHLLFLIQLTKYLGFYPIQNKFNYEYFNLLEATYTPKKSLKYGIEGEQLSYFNRLLGTNFDTISSIKMSQKMRQEILSILIQYYELHLTGFRKPKSLEVLKSIFN